MVEYIEIEPDWQLKNYIDSYWVSTGFISHKPINYLILPDCCYDIILNLGDEVKSLSKTNTMSKYKSYFVGMATKHSKIEISGLIFLVGIRFKPLGLNAFTKNIDYKSGKNQTIEINSISADEIFNGRMPIIEEIKPHLDTFLIKRLKPENSSNNIISNAIDVINKRQGLIRISELSESTNTSQRNLERLFSNNIGLTPKEFTKVTQLINVKRTMRQSIDKDLAQIAYDFNYYDQAHFSKDFLKFAGVVPSSFY